jgi:hypothetical protein
MPFVPALFLPQRRTIGGIYANVTIQEQERDELVITEHPVEQGSPINDHAYKRPSEVQIRAGWSAQLAGNLRADGGAYGRLLQLQAAMQPFDLWTGKRVYKDMMLQGITVITDQHSEYALMAEITCKQVIIVRVTTTKVSGSSNDPSAHDDPAATGPNTQQGDKASTRTGSVQDSTGSWREADAVTIASSQDVTGTPEAGTITQSPVADTPEARTVEQGYIANSAAPPNSPPIRTTNIPTQQVVVPIPPPPLQGGPT